MTSEEDRVAVIIPAYRSRSWLLEAIDSAVAQTSPPFEIVVVDDGSPEPLDALLGSRLAQVTYVRQPNRGPGAARNTGAACSDAALLAFLDDDDLFEPGKLAAQVAFLREHPRCALVCSDAWVFGDGREMRRKNRSCHHRSEPDLTLAGLLDDNPITTNTVLMRRTVFEDLGGFDEDRDLIAVEDYDLWIRVAERYSMGYLDQPLGRYRLNEAGLSAPRRFLDGVQKVLDNAVRRGVPTELRRRFPQRRCGLLLDHAWSLLEAGKAGGALTVVAQALAACPSHPVAWKLLARGLADAIRLPMPRVTLTRSLTGS